MKICKDCSKQIFGWKAQRCKSCAAKGYKPWRDTTTFSSIKGTDRYNFKGWHKDKGYVLIYMPEHPFANKKGHIYEHRLVIEKSLERYLTKEEVVDHINRIRDNNRIENLQLMTNQKVHLKTEWKKGTFKNRPTMAHDELGRFI